MGAALSPLRFSVAVLVREPRAGWGELTFARKKLRNRKRLNLGEDTNCYT